MSEGEIDYKTKYLLLVKDTEITTLKKELDALKKDIEISMLKNELTALKEQPESKRKYIHKIKFKLDRNNDPFIYLNPLLQQYRCKCLNLKLTREEVGRDFFGFATMDVLIYQDEYHQLITKKSYSRGSNRDIDKELYEKYSMGAFNHEIEDIVENYKYTYNLTGGIASSRIYFFEFTLYNNVF